MRQVLALFLVLFFVLPSALAGVNSHQAKISGSSTGAPPVGSQGFPDTREEDRLIFKYKAGTNGEVGKFSEGAFEVPYASINKFVYGETKHLRVGQTIALSALAGVGGLLLLLSKSHTHYLSIDYRDDTEHEQVIDFEVGKDAIRPLINSLEVRTGKKVEYEPGPVSPAKGKP
jgi:hypothetical protein